MGMPRLKQVPPIPSQLPGSAIPHALTALQDAQRSGQPIADLTGLGRSVSPQDDLIKLQQLAQENNNAIFNQAKNDSLPADSLQYLKPEEKSNWHESGLKVSDYQAGGWPDVLGPLYPIRKPSRITGYHGREPLDQPMFDPRGQPDSELTSVGQIYRKHILQGLFGGRQAEATGSKLFAADYPSNRLLVGSNPKITTFAGRNVWLPDNVSASYRPFLNTTYVNANTEYGSHAHELIHALLNPSTSRIPSEVFADLRTKGGEDTTNHTAQERIQDAAQVKYGVGSSLARTPAGIGVLSSSAQLDYFRGLLDGSVQVPGAFARGPRAGKLNGFDPSLPDPTGHRALERLRKHYYGPKLSTDFDWGDDISVEKINEQERLEKLWLMLSKNSEDSDPQV